MRGDVIHALLLAALLVGPVSGCAPEPSDSQQDVARPPAVLPSPAAPEAAVAGESPAIPAGADTSPSKVTARVRGAFRWDSTRALRPGEPAEFVLDVIPEVSVDAMSVSVTYTGELELLSETPVALGAVGAGETRASAIQVRLSAPGRVELRASVEGRGPAGEVLFQVSYPLYLILVDGRVLAGVDGFSALEVAELERRKVAGDITEEAYERAKRRIHGGGAREEITVTPPASGVK